MSCSLPFNDARCGLRVRFWGASFFSLTAPGDFQLKNLPAVFFEFRSCSIEALFVDHTIEEFAILIDTIVGEKHLANEFDNRFVYPIIRPRQERRGSLEQPS